MAGTGVNGLKEKEKFRTHLFITHLDSLLRGEISTQTVNPDDYLGIQVRTPRKPCCIVRYLIYILLYILARFTI